MARAREEREAAEVRARSLDLEVPMSILLRADEQIE